MERRSKKRAKSANDGPLTRGKLARSRSTRSRTLASDALELRKDVSPDAAKTRAMSRSARGKTNTVEADPDSDEGVVIASADEKEQWMSNSVDMEDDDGEEDIDDDDNDVEDTIGRLANRLSPGNGGSSGILRSVLLQMAGSGRFRELLSQLRQSQNMESDRQIDILTQLCEVISLGTEDSLASFPLDSFVPILIDFLQADDNPEVMNLAARSLTYMCEYLPPACGAVVRHGAVPIFCAKLLTIEYIDLAEQSLSALSKISREYPADCLRAGALMAVLSFLDFFSIHKQRLAVSTAANICRKLPSDGGDFVMEAVPILTNIFQYEDDNLVEHACLSMCHIVDSFASSAKILDNLCDLGVISQVARLVGISHGNTSQTRLNPSIRTALIKLLTTAAKVSPKASETLFKEGVSGTIRNILTGYCNLDNHGLAVTLADNSPEQLSELVSLINELLPPVPSSKRGAREAPETILIDDPALLIQFATDLIPSLMQVYSFEMNPCLNLKCLTSIRKMVYFAEINELKALLQEANISSFLAGVLSSSDPESVVLALRMAESLLTQLPATFVSCFTKEGVVSSLQGLVEGNDLSDAIAENTSIRSAARKLLKLHKKHEESHGSHVTATVGRLQDICNRIKALSGASALLDSTVEDEETVLDELFAVLCGAEEVSTFEFLGSGVVDTLIDYFSCGSGKAVAQPTMELRFQRFLLKALSSNGKASSNLLSTLIRKLIDTLSFLERFPVTMNQISGKGNSLGDGLKALFNHVKVRFEREEGEKQLLDCVPDTMYIDPSATMAALEDYLWAKVRRDREEPLSFLYQFKKDKAASRKSASGPSSSGPITRSHMARIKAEAYKKLGTDEPDEERGEKVDEDVVPGDGGEEEDEEEEEEDMEVDGASERDKKEFEELNRRIEAEIAAEDAMRKRHQERSKSAAPESARKSYSDTLLSGLASHVNASAAKAKGVPRLVFTARGESVTKYTTVFQVARDNLEAQETGMQIWEKTHTIRYRMAGEKDQAVKDKAAGDSAADKPTLQPFFEAVLSRQLSSLSGQEDEKAYPVLLLLYILEHLNRNADQYLALQSDRVEPGLLLLQAASKESFVSPKMSLKLSRQLRDVLSVATARLPRWCQEVVFSCPFLFPFELRRNYFQSTFLGLPRAMLHISRQADEESASARQGPAHVGGSPSETRHWRISRQKFTMPRSRILEHGKKVLEMYCSNKLLLEVEYSGEVGSGLGPTLEFYALLSRELQRTTLGMWRNLGHKTTSEEEFVHSPLGLFPCPLSSPKSTQSSKVVSMFRTLGRMMGKALQDSRMIDIPLSTAFYKLLLGQELTVFDVKSFDAELGQSLEQFLSLAKQRKALRVQGAVDDSQFTIHGASIDSLCLDFTLPGYPEFELKPDGSSVSVTLDNLEEYVECVVEGSVGHGVQEQVSACRSGINEVFPVSSLNMFDESEMDLLLCGRKEVFTAKMLMDNLLFQHGYSATSPEIVNLVEILEELDAEEQRTFLRFVTGAPRLPPGGLTSLHPRLTVVRKGPVPDRTCTDAVKLTDSELPSVMTCTNYLKLPPYSTKAIMKDRLSFAMNEGQGSFFLS